MNIKDPALVFPDTYSKGLVKRLHKRYSESSFGMTNFPGDFLVDLIIQVKLGNYRLPNIDTHFKTQLHGEDDFFVLSEMNFHKYLFPRLLMCSAKNKMSSVFYGEDLHNGLDFLKAPFRIAPHLMHSLLSFEYSWNCYKEEMHHTGHLISVMPANVYQEYKKYTADPNDPKDLSIPDVTLVPSFLEYYENHGMDVNKLRQKSINAKVKFSMEGDDLDRDPFVVLYVLKR